MSLEIFYNRVGGEFQEALRRLPGEVFIRKFLLRYSDDPSYTQLQTAVAQADWMAAFRAAHTIKGIAQNLSLGQLYRTAAALTDALRDGQELRDWELLKAVEEAQSEVLAALQEI